MSATFIYCSWQVVLWEISFEKISYQGNKSSLKTVKQLHGSSINILVALQLPSAQARPFLSFLRFTFQGIIGSRETFLTVFLREDQLSAQHLMSHFWKGGWFWPPPSAMFLAHSLRCLFLGLLPLVNPSLHWLLAVQPKPLTMGSCWQRLFPLFPLKDKLSSRSACWNH